MTVENIEEFADPAAMTGKLTNVEVFAAGTWRGSKTVTADRPMLDRIVQNFSTINQVPGYGVPVKLGHSSKVGDPAYGWMSDLQRVGDTLVADFTDMDPAIVDAIGKRRYNSVSVELYPRLEYGGKVFNDVLGGVALLGSEWPAVKGLKPLSASHFAEAGIEKLELTSKEPNVANDEAKFSQVQADAFVLAAETRVKAEGATALAAETAKTVAATARADAAEAALTKFKDDQDRAKMDALITAAEKSGKIVPANKAKFTKMADNVMKMSSEDRGDMITTLSDLIGGAKAVVKFGEDGKSEVEEDLTVKASDSINEKAQAHLATDTTGKMTYSDAVQHVLKTNPALRAAYAQE